MSMNKSKSYALSPYKVGTFLSSVLVPLQYDYTGHIR
jgi:hypothetical protein